MSNPDFQIYLLTTTAPWAIRRNAKRATRWRMQLPRHRAQHCLQHLLNGPRRQSRPLMVRRPVSLPAYSSTLSSSDAQHCIHRLDSFPSSTKSSHKAAHLRSYAIPYVKSGVATKVTQILSELGITHNRLVMPTRDTVSALEGLIDVASSLAEQKKVLDRLEQDIRVARARLGMRASEAPSASGEATPMDIDEEETGQVRDTSLGSTRSGRSRKNVGRNECLDNESSY